MRLSSRLLRAFAPSRSLPILFLVVIAAGCQASRGGKPVAKELSGSDPDVVISFWHSLAEEPVASNDQAFRALLLYMNDKDDSADYNARVQSLRNRRMLPKNFNEPAEAAVKRGTLAVAIMRLIGDRGGITTHVFGPTPRYATRELMFLNIYPPSTGNQAFSGNELVGIIGRVEDYQRGNPADVPAEVMPSQMSSN
jgi:hypothetical protein